MQLKICDSHLTRKVANKYVNARLSVEVVQENKIWSPKNLSAYYTWKNIRKQYKNNKLKVISLTCIDEFALPDGSYSVSDIQDYIELY